LIADAENVANNPSITSAELTAMDQDRLVAWGDTDNPDLGPLSDTTRHIEEMVLKRLKETLHNVGADGNLSHSAD
jgi:hypothetical protein